MRISFDFSKSGRGDYVSLREDYFRRVGHFAKISKAKRSDFEIVFVAGGDCGAERLGSEELADIVAKKLVQGVSGLRVSLDCDPSTSASLPGNNKDNDENSLRVLLSEETISIGLAEVLAAEQVYRMLMIHSGRNYHK